MPVSVHADWPNLRQRESPFTSRKIDNHFSLPNCFYNTLKSVMLLPTWEHHELSSAATRENSLVPLSLLMEVLEALAMGEKLKEKEKWNGVFELPMEVM